MDSVYTTSYTLIEFNRSVRYCYLFVETTENERTMLNDIVRRYNELPIDALANEHRMTILDDHFTREDAETFYEYNSGWPADYYIVSRDEYLTDSIRCLYTYLQRGIFYGDQWFSRTWHISFHQMHWIDVRVQPFCIYSSDEEEGCE